MSHSQMVLAYKARLMQTHVTCPICQSKRALTVQHIINKNRIPKPLMDYYPVEWLAPLCDSCNANNGPIGADTSYGRYLCIKYNVDAYGYGPMLMALEGFDREFRNKGILRQFYVILDATQIPDNE